MQGRRSRNDHPGRVARDGSGHRGRRGVRLGQPGHQQGVHYGRGPAGAPRHHPFQGCQGQAGSEDCRWVRGFLEQCRADTCMLFFFCELLSYPPPPSCLHFVRIYKFFVYNLWSFFFRYWNLIDLHDGYLTINERVTICDESLWTVWIMDQPSELGIFC